MRNQTSFRLTTTLLPTDMTAKTTQVINKVDSDGNKFYPTFSEETVVLTNDDRTIMETTRASCSNWVLTFTKRGLSDDASETPVANRKLTWNPWTIAFITVWAWDFIDKDDNITWTWNQTYTGSLTSEWSATYKWNATYKGTLTTEKWVKYPNFADATELQAYASPFAWMFATVDDTWELYRYNAVTEQWDLVSTVELSDFIIRESSSAPSWAADNVLTLVPNLQRIYLSDDVLVGNTRYADVLLVAWGWYSGGRAWWWGGWVSLREKIWLWDSLTYSITVWAAWVSGWVGGSTTMVWVWTVYGGESTSNYDDYAWKSWYAGLNIKTYPWGEYGDWTYNGMWWWGWAFWEWWNWVGSNTRTGTVWGDWGEWLISDITGTTAYYGRWGAGATDRDSWQHWTDWTTHTWYGVWGGIQWSAQGWVVIIRYPTDWSYGINSATWGTVTTSWGYTIHTFTSDGTFTIVS